MRALLSFCALALFAVGARADDAPPRLVFVDGKVTTEKRVAELEKQVAELKAEVAAMKKTAAKPACICGDGCKCKEGDCPAHCPVTSPAKAAVTSDPSLPAYLTIEGKLHQRAGDGSYWPVGGVAAPGCAGGNCAIGGYSYAAPTYTFGSSYASPSCSSCAGGNCRIPTIVK